ncbi:MAG: DUF2339 domain-containing protein [Chitinophagaceae bacterium]
MEDAIRQKIEQLTLRINELAGQQTSISKQLIQLVNELEQLKALVAAGETSVPQKSAPVVIEHKEVITAPPRTPEKTAPATVTPKPSVQKSKDKGDLEAFVGGNIASKAGILVTIIGIFIGSKYAIEHNLVSPVIRIICGYACGLALTGIAIRLKKKYEAYSAVLMGGGLSVLYFVTYIAYSFYGLWPQYIAFVLMLLCTAATVYAALVYNRVIIAHLAQITAYALPFLLSDNSGKYAVFFSYITIINAGIMVLAFRKNWKTLFNAAFVITWLIFTTWYVMSYEEHLHFTLAFTFLSIFFLIFYITFLAYKLVKKEKYTIESVILLLSNAFVFYALGYGLLEDHKGGENFTGLFTVINALIHLTVSIVIKRAQLIDKALYYLVLGLALVFITIAIPVQFDGNWVTLLWAGEALLVFYIGRTQQSAAYEKIATGLLALSFLSLGQDWFNQVQKYYTYTLRPQPIPFMGIIFLTGLLVLLSQGIMLYIHRSKKYISAVAPQSAFMLVYNYGLPLLFIVTGYSVFFVEILGYFSQQLSRLQNTDGSFGLWHDEIESMGACVLILYTIAYTTLIASINYYKIQNKKLAIAIAVATGIIALAILLPGMSRVNEQASLYYQRNGSGLYFGSWNIGIRYVIIAIAALLLFFTTKNVRLLTESLPLATVWTFILHIVIVGMLSFEYLHWATRTGPDNQYKLGLSILWGLYALFLIVQGIRKKSRLLRITAICFFIITLLKLFLYDLAGMGTVAKTISFISLGAILLLVSFLYNKYKDVLFGEE